MRRYEIESDLQVAGQAKKHSLPRRRAMTKKRAPKREKEIDLMISSLPKFESVLCVGCRDDSEVQSFIDRGFVASGLDISNKSPLILQGDAHLLTDIYEEDSFDVIYCVDAIEHMHDTELVLKNFRKVAKLGVFLDLPVYPGLAELDENHCSIFHLMDTNNAKRFEDSKRRQNS